MQVQHIQTSRWSNQTQLMKSAFITGLFFQNNNQVKKKKSPKGHQIHYIINVPSIIFNLVSFVKMFM